MRKKHENPINTDTQPSYSHNDAHCTRCGLPGVSIHNDPWKCVEYLRSQLAELKQEASYHVAGHWKKVAEAMTQAVTESNERIVRLTEEVAKLNDENRGLNELGARI